MKIGDNYQNIQNNYAYVNANNVAAASKVAAEKKDGSADAAAVGAATPNTDRAEFSADTKVTNKMSDSERAALVESLKSDLDNQMSRFTNMMMQTFNKQGITGLTAGSDAFWRQIASGNFTVDAATKAQAQKDIADDGYWGVEQTSSRIVDFATALAGSDPKQLEKMRDAFKKGFDEATSTWGKSLPDISQKTYQAVMDKFDQLMGTEG